MHSLDHVAPGGNYGGFQLVNFSDFTQPLVHHRLMFAHGARNKSLPLYCMVRTGVFDTKNMNSSRGKNLTQKLIIDN